MDAALVSPETPKIDELSQRVETLETLIVELKSQLGANKKSVNVKENCNRSTSSANPGREDNDEHCSCFQRG